MQDQHVVQMTKDMDTFDPRTEHIVFVPVDDGGDLYESFTLDWDVWTRMGSPAEIVVTVTAPQATGTDTQDPDAAYPLETT
jgi:hypothetical protein